MGLTSVLLSTLVGFLTLLIGYLWPHKLDGPELLSWTTVGIDLIALALASEAAAARSMTTGLSSVLVGVIGGRVERDTPEHLVGTGEGQT